jgi:hypothetical protein
MHTANMTEHEPLGRDPAWLLWQEAALMGYEVLRTRPDEGCAALAGPNCEDRGFRGLSPGWLVPAQDSLGGPPGHRCRAPRLRAGSAHDG